MKMNQDNNLDQGGGSESNIESEHKMKPQQKTYTTTLRNVR